MFEIYGFSYFFLNFPKNMRKKVDFSEEMYYTVIKWREMVVKWSEMEEVRHRDWKIFRKIG